MLKMTHTSVSKYCSCSLLISSNVLFFLKYPTEDSDAIIDDRPGISQHIIYIFYLQVVLLIL